MFDNKAILITGGTGSFGKKYTEILLKKYKPKRVVIYSRDELKQYEMAQVFKDKAMRFFIGDVRDYKRLRTAMNGIDYVIDGIFGMKISPPFILSKFLRTKFTPCSSVIQNLVIFS